MHQTILAYKRAQYGLWMLLLLLVCIGIYLSHGDMEPASGGTWQGYTLGVIATLLIIFLLLLGIRKRSYRSALGSVQGWTSAHVYAGTALLLIATLHAGFQIGFNVHTLAYILMVIVIVSGFVGLVLYQRYPMLLAESLGGSNIMELAEELAACDERIRRISQNCDSDVRVVTLSGLERTIMPHRFWERLFARDRSTLQVRSIDASNSTVSEVKKNRNQAALLDFLARRIPYSSRDGEAQCLEKLLTVCAVRKQILQRMRRSLQIKTMLKAWLWLHIPLSIGLMVALFVHIFSVFYFW